MKLSSQKFNQDQAALRHQNGDTSETSVSFKGKPITDFDAYLASLPYLADSVASEAFECAIEEERGIRRRMAEEKAE